MRELLNNAYFVLCSMAVIIFILTQVLKLPIKFGTKHIKNERVRKMTNATILLIPFALGILCDFVYSTYVVHKAFSVISGLGYGMSGISLYAIIERSFKVKIPNPYTDTEEGKAAIELVENVVADNEINEKDKDSVKEFWKKIK